MCARRSAMQGSLYIQEKWDGTGKEALRDVPVVRCGLVAVLCSGSRVETCGSTYKGQSGSQSSTSHSLAPSPPLPLHDSQSPPSPPSQPPPPFAYVFFCSLPLPPPCPPPLLPLSPSSNTYLHHAQPTGPKCRDRSIHPLSLSHPFLVCAAPGSIGNNDIAYQTRGPEHISHLRIKENTPPRANIHACQVGTRLEGCRVCENIGHKCVQFLQQHSPLHRVAWRGDQGGVR